MGKSLVVVRVSEHVLQPHNRFGKKDSSGYLRKVGPHRVLRPEQLYVTWTHVVTGGEIQQLPIKTEHVRK